MRSNGIFSHLIFHKLLLGPCVFCLIPILIFLLSRLTGSLPSHEEWLTNFGENHGPWRWGLQGMLLWLPQLILIAATLLTALRVNFTKPGFRTMAESAALLVAE